MQDIIPTKERVQQFKRMQALQLRMIAEVSMAQSRQAGDSLKTIGVFAEQSYTETLRSLML